MSLSAFSLGHLLNEALSNAGSSSKFIIACLSILFVGGFCLTYYKIIEANNVCAPSSKRIGRSLRSR